MRTFTFDTISDYRAAKATSGSGNVIYQALVGDTSVYSGSVVSKIKTGETFVDSINPFVTPDLGTDGDTLYKITDNGVVKYMYLRKGKTTWDAESFGQVFIKTDRLPTGSYTAVTNQSQVFTYADTKSEATGSGRARIAKIKGNSLGWNQRIDYTQFAETSTSGITIQNNNDGSFTMNGTATANSYTGCESNVVAGHKYYVKGCPTGGSDSTYHLRIAENGVSLGFETGNGFIFSRPSDSVIAVYVRVVSGTSVTNKVFWPIMVDLTLLYGPAIDGLTDDQIKAKFEAEYPNPYYAYDAGSLLNFKGNGMKVVGFNQWDEEWEVGAYSTATGGKSSNANYIRSANAVPVLPNTPYKIACSCIVVFLWYDADGNYIRADYDTSYSVNGNIHTSPANAHYLRFYPYIEYGNTYNHDICINLSGLRNGQYEPYKSSIIPINITSLRDKATHNLIFPNGLLSAGSVYDEIDLVRRKAIKRVGTVDLGSLSWIAVGGGFICDDLTSRAVGYNLLCGKYTTYQGIYSWTVGDKSLGQNGSTVRIYIRDDSYNMNVATFKTAMQNEHVQLNYELATPIEYDLSIPLFGTYPADEYVTKQLLPINGETPTTSPMSIEIQQL